MPERNAVTTLIIGCGYLGRFLLAGAPPGSCIVVTRSADRAAALAAAGAAALVADLTGTAGRERVSPALHGRVERALVLLPPSAFGVEPAIAATTLGAWLRKLGVARAVLASSTAVYGERDGADVDATTPVAVGSERARRLVDIEHGWRAVAPAARVVRLAGLYGPGRIVGAAAVRAGELLPGSGEAWLNLVRAEDAARALAAFATLDSAPETGLVSDGAPVQRIDYYTFLARSLAAPPVRFAGGGGRSGGSRRCHPDATWQALALRPRYADFRAGLADLLPAAAGPPHSRMN